MSLQSTTSDTPDHTAKANSLKRSSFVRDIFSGIVSQVLGVVLGFAGSWLLARWLGPGGRGQFASYTVWLGLTAGVAGLGIGAGALRVAGQNDAERRRISWVVIIVACGLGAFGSILMTTVHMLASRTGWGQTVPYLGYLALGVVISVQRTALTGTLLVHGRVVQTNVGGVIARIGNVLLIALFLAGLHTGTIGAVWALLGSMTLALGWYWLISRPQLATLKETRVWGQQLLAGGLKGYAADLCSLLIYRVDQLILSFGSPVALGYYALAASLSELVSLVPEAVTRSTHIRFRESSLGPELYFVLSWKLVMLTVAPIVLAGITLGHWIVPWVYGVDFQPSVAPLSILLVATFALASEKVGAAYRIAKGRLGSNSVLSVIGLVCNLALNLWWIPRWGIIGAAWASATSYWIAALAGFYVSCRVGRICWTKFLPRRGDLNLLMSVLRGG